MAVSNEAAAGRNMDQQFGRRRLHRWRRRLSRIGQTACRLFGTWAPPPGRPARDGMTMDGAGVEEGTRPAPGSAPDADAVLRRLARRALGFSGADIERLVREARQTARREQRALTYDDLDALLSASRPAISPQKRRRIAVHEAGHMLARILLDLGELTTVTIDTATGGFTEATSPDDVVDTAEQCHRYLMMTMAGRAAEQVVYGSALSGSGGFAHSDLAKATQLATAMEVSLGFGKRLPLLYRDPDHGQTMIRQDRDLARCVHRRLERAEASARKLIRRHRVQLDMIADALEAHGTLEGGELAALAQKVRAGSARS
ncbi:MAG: ATP-dependent Zn protease [Pseudaminobacter sp.]